MLALNSALDDGQPLLTPCWGDSEVALVDQLELQVQNRWRLLFPWFENQTQGLGDAVENVLNGIRVSG